MRHDTFTRLMIPTASLLPLQALGYTLPLDNWRT